MRNAHHKSIAPLLTPNPKWSMYEIDNKVECNLTQSPSVTMGNVSFVRPSNF